MSRLTFRLRSFVRRDSRLTSAQEAAQTKLWPQIGLSLEGGEINFTKEFARSAPTILEIGFGTGQSLLELAKQAPEKNFIGVETHKPGIGALCMGIDKLGLTNLKLIYADMVDVFAALQNDSLDAIQIFFPDPWPKRRHHPRRLIQPAFVNKVAAKLKPQGQLHLATDWQDYASHMMNVMLQAEAFTNLAGINQFSSRSSHRPILTKFETRAHKEGREIWDMQFVKK